MKRLAPFLLGCLLLGSGLAATERSLISIATQTPGVEYFASLLERVNLADVLELDGPFTVFAPVDDAFIHLPFDEFEALLEDPEALRQILSYHIVEGSFTSAELMEIAALTTLSGEILNITWGDHGSMINDAVILVADLEADNGILHVINVILSPVADQVPPA